MVEINISGEEFLYELEYRRLITYNLHDNAFPEGRLIDPIGACLLDNELPVYVIYSRLISESHVYVILQKIFR
jgi:hypothetical protein